MNHFIIFIAIIVLTIVLGKAAYLLTRRVLEPRFPKKNSKNLARVVQYVVFGIGFYSAFSEVLGFNFSAIVVSLGIIGIAVALAAQQIIQNAFAGIIISITRPMELEDMVEIGGMPPTGVCRVKDISLMNVALRDHDGRMVYIPNNYVITNKVVNYTKAGFVSISLPLFIRTATDLPKVIKAVDDISYDDLKILPHMEGEEKTTILGILGKPQVRRIFGPDVNMSQFNPKVFVRRVEASRTSLEIEFWIREIELRDMISSKFLVDLDRRLVHDGVLLADS